jgi:uncharacterized protein
MPSNLNKLVSLGIAQKVPSGLDDLIVYETYMGSSAYGVSSDTSDMDCLGFAIPERDQVFPHLQGYVHGFGKSPDVFQFYTEHHMMDKSTGKQYDYTIHSITKFFNLLMTANVTVVETLFCPVRCIIFNTPVGRMVRDNRKLFLTKKVRHTAAGFAFNQLRDLKKELTSTNKRYEDWLKYGMDRKAAYHVVRLIDQAFQVLQEGELDLEANREKLKSIRAGEWTLTQIQEYFDRREKQLDEAYENSKLPHKADEAAVKNLLLNCLEEHFGTLTGSVIREDVAATALREIEDVLKRYKTNA